MIYVVTKLGIADLLRGGPMNVEVLATITNVHALPYTACCVLWRGREYLLKVVNSYDFSQSGLIVDIGGGHGALIQAILTIYPSAQGLVFDLPEVVERARGTLAAAGVMDRDSS
jgi:hypothetical protein